MIKIIVKIIQTSNLSFEFSHTGRSFQLNFKRLIKKKKRNEIK